jgi:hypothetical protein
LSHRAPFAESLDMLKGADEVHLVMVDPVEGEFHHGAGRATPRPILPGTA